MRPVPSRRYWNQGRGTVGANRARALAGKRGHVLFHHRRTRQRHAHDPLAARATGAGRRRILHRHGRVRHHGLAARGGARRGRQHSRRGPPDQRLCLGRGGWRTGAGRAGSPLATACAANGTDGFVCAGQFCDRTGAGLSGGKAPCALPPACHMALTLVLRPW